MLESAHETASLATTSVEVTIAAAAMLVAPTKLTAAVRVFRFAFWAPPVVTPECTVIVHLVSAGKIVVSVTNVRDAVAVPLLADDTSNVVVPQPADVGDDNVPNVKLGSTSVILSSKYSWFGNMNVNEIDVAVLASGSAMVSMLVCKMGAMTFVDWLMATGVISVALANTASAVRLVRSAFCAPAPVVMPLATVTVHGIYAFNVAAPAWKVSVAPARPEADPDTLKVVEPHPDFDGDARVPNTKVGTTTLTVSPDSRFVLSVNVNEMEDAADVTAFEIDSDVWVKYVPPAGADRMAVDLAISVIGMSIAAAKVTATVRVFESAA